MTLPYDCAVIGLGLVGSAALRHLTDRLARSGGTVIGIGVSEPPDHARHRGPFASHYDSGRVTRTLDARWEWAVLARRAIAEYHVIEAASGIRFHWPVGAVMAERDDARIAAITANARRMDVRLRVDSTTPDQRICGVAGATFLSEPGPAGFIDPRRMLAAQLTAARRRGAEIHHAEVVGLERQSGVWRATLTGADEIEARSVVVATGAHTDEIRGLPLLPPLLVRCETVVMATPPVPERDRLAGLPAILAEVDHPVFEDVYMVPPTRYPDGVTRIKMGAGRHHPVRADTAAQRRVWMSGDTHAADLDDLRRLLEALVPGLDATDWMTKPCLITDTPTGRPYLDVVEEGLVVATGGNGYAAKSADAIGALAAGLVTPGEWSDPDLDTRLFAV